MNNNIDFEQIKHKVLPYFIQIYGDEFKDIISEKINQIIPVFYSSIELKKSKMRDFQNTKKIELTFKFLEDNNIIVENELKQKIIKNNANYELKKITEADKLLTACFGEITYNNYSELKELKRQQINSEYEKQRIVDKLNLLGINVSTENYNNWVSTNDSDEAFKKIEHYQNCILKLDKEYNDFCNQFSDLNNAIEKSEQITKKTNQKYMLEFLKAISNYMTNQDKQILDDYITSSNKPWFFFSNELEILKIIGNNLHANALLESFSSKATEMINDKKTSNFKKQTIIENRIKYYKLIGLENKQMTPEEFINSDDATKYAPTQEMIDEIISKKQHFAKLAENEILINTSTCENNLQYLNQFSFSTDNQFNIDDIKTKMICIKPNVIMENNQPKCKAILVYSPESCIGGYADVNLIHEINHAIELTLIEYNNGNACYKCGFEIINDDENNTRDYEMFSELINQMIAIEVTEAMHNDNIYLFDNPASAKSRGGTSYEQQSIFIKNLYTPMKKEIMKARIGNNLNPLYEKIGKENFDNLNTIINEYRNMPYYKMMEDLIQKKDTALTRKRNELIQKANQICELIKLQFEQSQDYNNLIGISK